VYLRILGFADINSEPGSSGQVPSVSGSSSALPHPQKIYVRVVKHDTDISSSEWVYDSLFS